MFSRSFLRRWFGPRPGTIRKAAPQRPSLQGRPRLEELESRLVMTAAVSLTGGVLRAVCDNAATTVTLNQSGTTTTLNGKSFANAAFSRIEILGGTGKDTIKVLDTPAGKPVVVKAGAGNDTIQIGNAANLASVRGALTLDAGAGDDALRVENASASSRLVLNLGTGYDNTYIHASAAQSVTVNDPTANGELGWVAVGASKLNLTNSTDRITGAIHVNSAATLYVMDAADAARTITVDQDATGANGRIVGLTTVPITYTAGQVLDLGVSQDGHGGNTFVINNPAVRDYTSIGTGLGNDRVNVLATTTDVYSVNFGGRDTFTLGSLGQAGGGTLANIRADVLVGDDGTGLTDLVVDNSGDLAAHDIVLGESSAAMAELGATASITGVSGEIAIYSPLASMTVRGGALDTFTQVGQFDFPVHFLDWARPKATFNLADGVLRVEGSPTADILRVVENANGTISVDGMTIRYTDDFTDADVASLLDFQVVRVEVWARGGDDLIRNDTYKPSTLVGGGGHDTIFGGHGMDDMYGEEGDDTLFGSPRGELGEELGVNSNDVLWGGEGNDTLWGGYGNDNLVGGNGRDVLHGQWGSDWVVGSNWDKVNHRPVAAEVGENRDILFGGNGDDKIYGGDGDDDLSGGWDSDELHGEGGNDKLWGAFWDSPLERPGHVNDDSLYGGPGLDTLDGGDGNDGLFGGWNDGKDTLIGGRGADRFLQTRFAGQLIAEDDIPDRKVEDATIDFIEGRARTEYGVMWNARRWTDAEVEQIDRALAVLHRHTGNTRLLKTAARGDLTFERLGDPDGPLTVGGWNEGTNIVFINASFNDPNYLVETVFHEVGHNWDDVGENATIEDFRKLSGWQRHANAALPAPAGYLLSKDKKWDYKVDAQFHRDYGRTDPLDDFADSFAAYFMQRVGLPAEADAANAPAKADWVGRFLTTLA